jgi:hypothetical protein
VPAAFRGETEQSRATEQDVGNEPGSGTPKTAMQPNGQTASGTVRVLPASGTKTSPLNGSTAIECGLDSDPDRRAPNAS